MQDTMYIKDLEELEDIELVHSEKLIGFRVSRNYFIAYADSRGSREEVLRVLRTEFNDMEILSTVCGLLEGIYIEFEEIV